MKKHLLRFPLILLSALLVLPLLFASCAREPEDKINFRADNEILTYRRIDPDKTTLLVSMLGDNVDVKRLAAAYEVKYPDVQIVCLDITGGDGDYYPTDDWVEHGLAPDIIFTSDTIMHAHNEGAGYLYDLSGHSVISNFEVGTLDRLAVDGHIYYLPGPSDINCICYNKTMFAQYGWEVPATFDDFVTLCARITEDTNGAVEPWNPNAKYENMLATAIEGFTYGELFCNVEDKMRYDDFLAGKAAFKNQMEPFFEVIDTLCKTGILREEHFTYSATTRGKEFQAGKIAMVNHTASAYNSSNTDFEVGYFAYPSTDGKLGFVSTTYSLTMCVPIKDHTEVENDAVEKFISFFASPEGQSVLIGDKMLIGNIKGMPEADNDVLKSIKPVIEQGNQFAYFVIGGGRRAWGVRGSALSIFKGEKTVDNVIDDIDAHPFIEDAGQSQNTRTRIAEVVPGGLTMLEFSSYIADMYRDIADADIGLISHGVAYRGNLVRLFEGDIYDSYIRILMPRSFENDSTLIKVSMSGAQILDALNNPGNDVNSTVRNSIYAFSGLKCTVAPWKDKGEKILSVTLPDGSALDENHLYTVAVWAGTVDDAYITEVLTSYEGSWIEHMSAKMKADGVIAPADDGRITIVWN